MRPATRPAPAGAEDHTTVLPPIDHRSTSGLPRTGFRPEEDPGNAHRTTIGLRRPDPLTRSGTFPAVPADQPGTRSGTFPAVPSDQPATRSGTFPVVREDPVSSTGGFSAFGDQPPATGHQDIIGTGRATSTGGFRQADDVTGTGGDRPATASGEFRAAESRTTSTGGFRTGETRTSTTGSQRTVGESTSTGGFRTAAEGSATSTGSHATVTEGRSSATGGHRTATSGASTSTGTHRAMGKIAGRRRIAKWPIVVAVFIVLLVVAGLGWGWANNILNSQAEAQANACTDGNSTMTVVVTPSAQKPVSAAAARWNQAKTVVHAHCVQVTVRAVPSQQVFDALTGKAALNTIGGLPAAWIPENSYWANQLQTTQPGLVGAPAESVASASSADYPYIGLAGNTIDDVQARAAQVFRDYLREPAQQNDFTAAGL